MARNNKETPNSKVGKASSSKATGSTKKTTKKKKKKVVVSHIVKPEKMNLEEWQVKLRQQVSKTERFVINSIDEELCPGEYIVRNPEKHNEYKVVVFLITLPNQRTW